jgi:hypothetical protein
MLVLLFYSKKLNFEYSPTVKAKITTSQSKAVHVLLIKIKLPFAGELHMLAFESPPKYSSEEIL